jgi:hypothetical protein
MDCLECDEKACKFIAARNLKIRPGDIIDVKTVFGKEQRFMYIGKQKIDDYKCKRIMYRFEDQKIIFVDSDFFKLKKAKLQYSDKELLANIRKEHSDEI